MVEQAQAGYTAYGVHDLLNDVGAPSFADVGDAFDDRHAEQWYPPSPAATAKQAANSLTDRGFYPIIPSP